MQYILNKIYKHALSPTEYHICTYKVLSLYNNIKFRYAKISCIGPLFSTDFFRCEKFPKILFVNEPDQILL